MGPVTIGFIGGLPAPAKVYRFFVLNDPSIRAYKAIITGNFKRTACIYFEKSFIIIHDHWD